MATEFKLPELGEGVDSADVSRIFVAEGDTIDADVNVMELETEKAVADLPCPHAGQVAKVHVSEGDTIEVGQTLLTIEDVKAAAETASEDEPPEQEQAAETEAQQDEEKESDKEAAQTAETPPAEEEDRRKQEAHPEEPKPKSDDAREPERSTSATTTAGDGKHDLPPAGPATRRLARKLDVQLEEMKPREGGRITQEQVVQAYLESRKLDRLAGEEPQLPDFGRFGPTERTELGKVAQTASRRLSAAWRTIPHVTQHGLADATDLEAARRRYNEESEEAPRITMTAIAVKAVAGLLRDYPKFNSSLDTGSGELILKHYYHIGVAVDTDRGLLVPVIRDADRKSVEEIAGELAALAERARKGQLQQDDMEGGTFTVSNQGGIGGAEFTPIVNFPEVAILGIARARSEVRMSEGRPQQRLMLPLSLSYDHRVINGADAARFMEQLTRVFADSFTMLIEC